MARDITLTLSSMHTKKLIYGNLNYSNILIGNDFKPIFTNLWTTQYVSNEKLGDLVLAKDKDIEALVQIYCKIICPFVQKYQDIKRYENRLNLVEKKFLELIFKEFCSYPIDDFLRSDYLIGRITMCIVCFSYFEDDKIIACPQDKKHKSLQKLPPDYD
jgi:hypothetical protein